MRNGSKIALDIVALVIILAGVWWMRQSSAPQRSKNEKITNEVTFICSSGDSIHAAFRNNSVDLLIDGKRTLNLQRARSASGARYVSQDSSIVFWNKGNTAFITEDDSMTYRHCVVKGETYLVNLKLYQNNGVRFRYPNVFKQVHESVADTQGWSYASAQNGNLLVQLKLSSSFQPNTNLSEGTFTVGWSDDPDAMNSCMKEPHAPAVSQQDTVNKSGKTFFRSQYNDAGAGNFYKIVQYRSLQKGRCYSIEEMVHSTNIHNYPADRNISEFDSARVWRALSVPWQTLRMLPSKSKN